MVGVLLVVGKEQSEIVGDGFIDPLIAVSAPANYVAPPLMGHFVKGDQLGEVFLTAFGKSGTLLGGGRQKRKGGDVEKAGPTLAKCSGNLRYAELLEGERAHIIFVEANG